jgi:hypothetical protein
VRGVRDAGRVLRDLGEPEVQDARALRREHHVAGLEVPVRHALRVRGGQAVGDLDAQRERFLEGHRSPREPRVERLALEVLHDEEDEPVLLAHVEERADVGVRELRGHLGLAEEAFPEAPRRRPSRPSAS